MFVVWETPALPYCWLLRESTLFVPPQQLRGTADSCAESSIFNNEGVREVALKQTQIKQNTDDLRAAGDGRSRDAFVCPQYKSYTSLPAFVSQPPLSPPSRKEGSWGRSRGKWAPCRFRKLFPDPNRGAWAVPIMKWNEMNFRLLWKCC